MNSWLKPGDSLYDPPAGPERQLSGQGVDPTDGCKLDITISPGGPCARSRSRADRQRLSAQDRINQAQGDETTIDQTLRLLYVTCSRAKSSLALVIRTADPAKVRDALLRLSWFEDAELLSVPDA
jgi:hypothetical protein